MENTIMLITTRMLNIIHITLSRFFVFCDRIQVWYSLYA